jgi:lysophospholipase L1-like esterase
MKTLYLALFTAIAICGCNAQTNTKPITDMTASTGSNSNGGAHTYLALGDSYTIGQSVPQDGSFPYQLVARLNATGENVAAPTIIAVTGWTTDNLINAISQSNIHDKTYDFVTLLIGVNDQYQGLSQTNYRTKFKQVLGTAISFAKGDTSRVFVVSIPDYGVTPFANGQESIIGPLIDQFNAINLDESQKAGVHYVNITPISKAAANDLTLVADDGLHPSAKMYGLWVTQLVSGVTARLDR